MSIRELVQAHEEFNSFGLSSEASIEAFAGKDLHAQNDTISL